MRRSSLIIGAVLLITWLGVAGWQFHEYDHECAVIRDRLRRHGESLMSALLGGIRSHRRIGPFFEGQLQGVLDDLVRSEDVLAVVIASMDGRALLSAGRGESITLSAPITFGGTFTAEGYRLTAELLLTAEPAGGLGWGGGWGRGARGPRPWGGDDPPGPLAGGGRFATVLLLDRTSADAQCRRAAWTRSSVALAGAALLLCLGLVWQVTVRLATARGGLQAEQRHSRELSQAAAGLAHETRNPLGLIRGWTQRLAQSPTTTPEDRARAGAVLEECDRLTARINQFLTFARPAELRPEPTDPGAVLAELAILLGPDLDSKRLTLRRDLPSAGVVVRADRERLRQALFNLLQNAIQWSPEGAAVEVGLRRSAGGRIRVEVADRGPGVPAGAAASLFTPYFTTRSGGTGLGLAMVARIAAAHGWTAGHTLRPGGGVVFWLDGLHG